MADSQGQRRVCDYCGASTALLYCRADTAKLCFGCDREVHSTNPLFGKHGRSPLCDACDESSASIFCETERFLLCQNCDWERHDLSRGGGAGVVHNRRPIEGFTGCPSASELMGFLGVEDLGVKVNECLDGDDKEAGVGEFSDVLLWETPAFVTLDDLIVSRDDSCALRAVDVPSLPKNRNATCGRHKKEMLRQLRLLAKPESNFHFDEAEPVSNIHLPVLEQALQSADMQTGCDVDGDENAFYEHEWFCNDGETKGRAYQPSAFSGSCHEPTTSEKPAGISVPTSASECLEGPLDQPNKPNLSSLVPRAQYDLTGLDRESAISRYKEKRKTRRYEKHIRYESRKARAESRIRVKGRFAKMDKT